MHWPRPAEPFVGAASAPPCWVACCRSRLAVAQLFTRVNSCVGPASDPESADDLLRSCIAKRNSQLSWALSRSSSLPQEGYEDHTFSRYLWGSLRACARAHAHVMQPHWCAYLRLCFAKPFVLTQHRIWCRMQAPVSSCSQDARQRVVQCCVHISVR